MLPLEEGISLHFKTPSILKYKMLNVNKKAPQVLFKYVPAAFQYINTGFGAYLLLLDWAHICSVCFPLSF